MRAHPSMRRGSGASGLVQVVGGPHGAALTGRALASPGALRQPISRSRPWRCCGRRVWRCARTRRATARHRLLPLRGLDQSPADARRALPRDVAEPGATVGGADGCGEPGTGAEMARSRKRSISPTSAITNIAARGPIPRSWQSTSTRGRGGRTRRSLLWPARSRDRKSPIRLSRLSRRRRAGSRNGSSVG
jgi:hypothetical protein